MDALELQLDFEDVLRSNTSPLYMNDSGGYLYPVRQSNVVMRFTSALSCAVLNHGCEYKILPGSTRPMYGIYFDEDGRAYGYKSISANAYNKICRHLNLFRKREPGTLSLSIITLVCAASELNAALEWTPVNKDYCKNMPVYSEWTSTDDFILTFFEKAFVTPEICDYSATHGFCITQAWLNHGKFLVSGDTRSFASAFFNKYIIGMITSENALKNTNSYNASVDLIPIEYSADTSYDHVSYVRFAELQKIAEYGDMPGGLELFFTYAFYNADDLFRTKNACCSKDGMVPFYKRLGVLIEGYSNFYQQSNVNALFASGDWNMMTPYVAPIQSTNSRWSEMSEVGFEETTPSKQKMATVVKVLRRDKSAASLVEPKVTKPIEAAADKYESSMNSDILHKDMQNGYQSGITSPRQSSPEFSITEHVNVYKDGGSFQPFASSLSRPFSPIRLSNHVDMNRMPNSNVCIELRGVTTAQRSMIMDYIMNTITGTYAEFSIKELR